ncbi:GerAB/ArcD/ProY family transporter [Edaphobacillus lindanitolerans]|uniref:Spore germination protein KB n=1 Tax=Edaphobacillus lindanitolerans TaxID=550447 RepID=A0A1U7PK68_9BACI|nr:endospore germination permease [Edaphobacillus lindanitolerans]SIT72288.1 spore germination protein KB [Edaphobacillus lindanitolerans]
MKGIERISAYQFGVLVFFFTTGTSILAVPAILAEKAGQDAWLAAAAGTLAGLGIIFLYGLLARCFPRNSLFGAMEWILGRWIGKFIMALFILVMVNYASSLLYYSGAFLQTEMLPNTPMSMLNFLMLATILIGVFLGLETIARTAEVFILVYAVFLFLLFIFLLPAIKIENIQPVFESGAGTIARASFPLLEVFALNTITMLVIYSASTDSEKQAGRSFLIGSAISAAVIILLTFLCVSILGGDNTAKQQYPGYELAKKISVGNFIQRVESTISFLWLITLYFKASIYIYAAILGTARLFGQRNYRTFILPLGTIAFLLSLTLYPSIIDFKEWRATTGMTLSIFSGVFVPLLPASVYLIRRKKLAGREKAG